MASSRRPLANEEDDANPDILPLDEEELQKRQESVDERTLQEEEQSEVLKETASRELKAARDELKKALMQNPDVEIGDLGERIKKVDGMDFHSIDLAFLQIENHMEKTANQDLIDVIITGLGYIPKIGERLEEELRDDVLFQKSLGRFAGIYLSGLSNTFRLGALFAKNIIQAVKKPDLSRKNKRKTEQDVEFGSLTSRKRNREVEQATSQTPAQVHDSGKEQSGKDDTHNQPVN